MHSRSSPLAERSSMSKNPGIHLNVEEPRHPSHHVRAPLQRQRIESGRRRFGYCFWRRPPFRDLVLGIVLAIYLTWQAQRSLHNNLESIADELRLDMTVPGSHDLR